VLRDVLQQEKGLRLVSMKSIGATELFSMQAISGDNEGTIQQRQVAKLLQFYKDRDKYGLDADFDKSRADLVKQQARENRKNAEVPQVYKHGILLDMVGDYSSTLRYLKKLENLPWKFYWDAVRYEVTNYPKARIRILVNTISLDKEWVHV
ncbi:MAG: hypothetical protein ACC707_12630, partial [Thiohalomonadales bacterium]